MNKQVQIEHFFRHEYGKLVAILSRRIGVIHIDIIEDSVQWSMTQALTFWSNENIPSNTFAWLYKVAYRYIISELRAKKRQGELITESVLNEDNHIQVHEDTAFSGEVSDSMLRMLFFTCHEKIPIESQLVFTLKSLCGFSIKEISLRLFISEANVYKRFARAKKLLKMQDLTKDEHLLNDSNNKLPALHYVLYLIFTEGYLSSHEDIAIRKDLCEEAIRLTILLSESKYGNVPNSYALLALMHFHLARINTRQDEVKALVLFEEQDRSQWDQSLIEKAIGFLEYSATGDSLSRYHVEAGIAAEHCLSPSFKETRWSNIITSYVLLERIAPSPLHLLNRAIAMAEWQGPQAGLAILRTAEIPHWLNTSYYWYAVQADLLLRCNEQVQAEQYANLAIDNAPSKHIKQLLQKRLWRTK